MVTSSTAQPARILLDLPLPLPRRFDTVQNLQTAEANTRARAGEFSRKIILPASAVGLTSSDDRDEYNSTSSIVNGDAPPESAEDGIVFVNPDLLLTQKDSSNDDYPMIRSSKSDYVASSEDPAVSLGCKTELADIIRNMKNEMKNPTANESITSKDADAAEAHSLDLLHILGKSTNSLKKDCVNHTYRNVLAEKRILSENVSKLVVNKQQTLSKFGQGARSGFGINTIAKDGLLGAGAGQCSWMSQSQPSLSQSKVKQQQPLIESRITTNDKVLSSNVVLSPKNSNPSVSNNAVSNDRDKLRQCIGDKLKYENINLFLF